MAASDEFPRNGIAAIRPVAGTAATITLPATPGIEHVLVSISASMINGGAAVNMDVVIEVAGLFDLPHGNPLCELGGNAVPTDAMLQGAWTGKINAGPGNALTVRFNAGVASWIELLQIEWYDI